MLSRRISDDIVTRQLMDGVVCDCGGMSGIPYDRVSLQPSCTHFHILNFVSG